MGETLAQMSSRRRAALCLYTPAEVEIFTRVLTHGPIGRVDVGYQTGLSQAKVTKTVTPLIEAGFVVESDHMAPRQAPGRPVRPLSVVPDSLRAIGVYLGANEVVGVAVTMTATVTHTARAPLPDKSLDGAVEAIDLVVRRVLRDLGDAVTEVAGVGVTISGEVDSRVGIVRGAPSLDWADAPLGPRLTRRLDADVVVSNDIRAMTLAEDWFGVGVDADSFAIVNVSETIGCGIYVNGDALIGSHGLAGGLGHLVVEPSSATCSCAQTGTLDAIASHRAVLAAMNHEAPQITLSHILELAGQGVPLAVCTLDAAAAALGTGIAALANLIDPEVVIVRAEGFGCSDHYAVRIREAFAERAVGAVADCEIVVVEHTVEDSARAAAACVIRATVRQQFPW